MPRYVSFSSQKKESNWHNFVQACFKTAKGNFNKENAI